MDSDPGFERKEDGKEESLLVQRCGRHSWFNAFFALASFLSCEGAAYLVVRGLVILWIGPI